MLVLSRLVDESIMIGNDVAVRVVDIRGDKVKLGVNAPRSVTVHRTEIYELIRQENQQAAQLRPEDVPGIGAPAAPPPIKLAVLASGGGTTLQNLLDRIADKRLNARIVSVVVSRHDAQAVARARSARLPTEVIPPAAFGDIAAFSERIFQTCEQAGAELVCCAGWLSLLRIPDRWFGKVMNIHPALLPSFGGKGMYGQRVHEAVLAHGSKVSGCTVHFVDNTYDTGPIILQRACPVHEEDTPQSLAARVFDLEKGAYPDAIRLYQQGRLRIEGRRVRIASR